jgi:hypothetical protein
MKREYALMLAIVLVLLSGIPLITDPGATNNANAKYADTQTQAKANNCDDSSNCAINSPQTQGDGTANSPTNLQISEANEEASTSLPPTSGEPTAFLQIATHVRCDPGFDCPNANDFEYDIIPVEQGVSAEPQTFIGSDIGTVIKFTNFDEPTIDFVLLSAFPTTPEMSTMIIPREARCDPGAVIVHDMRDIFEGSLDTSSTPRCEIDFHFRAD